MTGDALDWVQETTPCREMLRAQDCDGEQVEEHATKFLHWLYRNRDEKGTECHSDVGSPIFEFERRPLEAATQIRKAFIESLKFLS